MNPAGLALAAGGAVLAIGGITTLARSPLVRAVYEQQQRRKADQGADRRPARAEADAADKR